MTAPAVHRGGGSGREGKQLADNAADDAGIAAENQPKKPVIDLASWAALGGTTKPSRTERRQKRSWRRAAK